MLADHSNTSIPYSFVQVLGLAATGGLDLLEQRTVNTTYTGEQSVHMKPESYHVPLTVWRLARPEDRFDLNDVTSRS